MVYTLAVITIDSRGGAHNGRCSSHSGSSSSYSGGSSSYSAPSRSAPRSTPTAPTRSDPVVRTQTFARRAPAEIHQGSRGGQYYHSASGSKVYVTPSAASSRSAPSAPVPAPAPRARPATKPATEVATKPSKPSKPVKPAKPTKPATKNSATKTELTFARRAPAELKTGPKGGQYYETASGRKEYVKPAEIKYLDTTRQDPICNKGFTKHGDRGKGTEAAHKCSHRVARAVLCKTRKGPQTTAETEAFCRALNDNSNLRIKSQKGNRALDERRDKRIADIVEHGGHIKEHTTAQRALQSYKGILQAGEKHDNACAKGVAEVIGNLVYMDPTLGPTLVKDMASKATGATPSGPVTASGIGALPLSQV
ncbi:hypothetical protein KIPB_000690 [Kipferlia bialata]|uniref:Uncharacterized protein n=1 Tax=Kipferlia bialata TaxID=797122 RepID=A0A9K3CPL7_9EUKA|nr:hypothetical protein KIPB_000690 [Kipferlia bialata]|eukprot:g690.t1